MRGDSFPATPPKSVTSTVSVDDIRSVLESIYSNGYFTNHGPLASEFEYQLESFLKVDHAIAVGNSSLALLIALTAMDCKGRIFTGCSCRGHAVQMARWIRKDVFFLDSQTASDTPSIATILEQVSPQDDIIVLTEPWGQRLSKSYVDELAELNYRLIIIAFDSFGARSAGEFVTQSPNVITVFCFRSGNAVSTQLGGAVATNNAELACRARNIRSSYGARQSTPVLATCNGRFSEFQAGVGLISLSRIKETISHNQKIVEVYRREFNGLHQFKLPIAQRKCQPNYQQFPIHVPDRLEFDFESLAKLGIERPSSRISVRNEFVRPHHQHKHQTILLPVNACSSERRASEIATRMREQVNPVPRPIVKPRMKMEKM